MKMTDEVMAALEVLKTAAENDFERHRIDVLIKDLTDPPQVEVIDKKHQSFNGITFSKLGKEKYYRTTAIRLHTYAFDYYFGIPEGDYEVHHKDGTPDNNAISNLQLLSRAEHNKVHHSIRKSNGGNEFVCEVCGKKFTSFATSAKFCSSKCRERQKYKNAKTFEKVCAYCGKTFKTKDNRQNCCSRECGQKLRTEKTFEERQCIICGKIFKTLKRYKTLCCSRSCAAKYQHQRNSRRKIFNKICPVCGKNFTVTNKHPNQKCCSPSCGAKNRLRR